MQQECRVGIDLGGTKIEGILLGRDENVIVRKRVATGAEEGYRAILRRVADLIEELRRQADCPCLIGLGTPGSISPQSGLLRNSNTTALIGEPLREDLEQILGQKVVMDNDANCFALAEARLGAGRGGASLFGIIMGTGVGGGIVLNGKLHGGHHQIAGEWGHHILYPRGNPCFCGDRGCVETYLSGPALERRWSKLSGRKQTLPQISAILDRTPRSPQVTRFRQEVAEDFGIALSNVINILDPEIVVLGGGVSNLRLFYEEGVEAVHRHIFSDVRETQIVQNQLGDSSGVFGAAWLP